MVTGTSRDFRGKVLSRISAPWSEPYGRAFWNPDGRVLELRNRSNPKTWFPKALPFRSSQIFGFAE